MTEHIMYTMSLETVPLEAEGASYHDDKPEHHLHTDREKERLKTRDGAAEGERGYHYEEEN